MTEHAEKLQELFPRHKITMEDGVIQILGKKSGWDDIRYDSLYTLCDPYWNHVPAGTKLVVKYFEINISDNPVEWDDVYCARWMMRRYGRECLQGCVLMEYGEYITQGRYDYEDHVGWHSVSRNPEKLLCECGKDKKRTEKTCLACNITN